MSEPITPEERLRDALRGWSEEAPHDPDLVGSVLDRSAAQTGPRPVVRRIVASGLVVALSAAAVVVALQVLDGRNQTAVEVPLVSTPSATAPGCASATPPAGDRPTVPAGPEDPLDAAAWEKGLSRRWGLKDITVPARAVTDTAATFPEADGGQTYDDDTLTYTQWVVAGSADGPALQAAVQAAFDDAAAGSNIGLDFGVTPLAQVEGVRWMDELVQASRTDPRWPRGVEASGSFRPELGRFELAAGDRYDDPDVQAYFDRRWPCYVTLTPAEMTDLVLE